MTAAWAVRGAATVIFSAVLCAGLSVSCYQGVVTHSPPPRGL